MHRSTIRKQDSLGFPSDANINGSPKMHLLLPQALQKYTIIARDYSDLALAERARVKRALMLYETGQVDQALLELEDEEVALRGNAEVPSHNQNVPLMILSKTNLRRNNSAETYCNYLLRTHALHLCRCMPQWLHSYMQRSHWKGNEQSFSGKSEQSLIRATTTSSGWQKVRRGGPGSCRPWRDF